jgi:hypothetical protein
LITAVTKKSAEVINADAKRYQRAPIKTTGRMSIVARQHEFRMAGDQFCVA